jgi:hypothetical protein
MSNITLEAIKARHDQLGEQIEQFEAQAKAKASRIVAVHAATIELRSGEHYAGTVLDESGAVKHHLILMADRPSKRLNWQDAKAWASKIGGALPDRQEQALLFANCKAHLDSGWHWSSQEHEEDASYAWGCDFLGGDQYDTRKSYEGSAVAVRRG